jgi:hypothetical protein
VNLTRSQDRRKSTRYPLALPVRYRLTQRNTAAALIGGGTTCDISPAGVSFTCRETLPVGAHIEVVAKWPARAAGHGPLNLKMTGFVVRSSQGGTAVRVTSHKLCVDTPLALPYRASA